MKIELKQILLQEGIMDNVQDYLKGKLDQTKEYFDPQPTIYQQAQQFIQPQQEIVQEVVPQEVVPEQVVPETVG